MRSPAFSCSPLLIALLLATALPAPCRAQSDAPAFSSSDDDSFRPAPSIADGKGVHGWLQATDEGKQASRHRQTLSGPAMSRAYLKYLNSFGTPGMVANSPGMNTASGSASDNATTPIPLNAPAR
jgi:hypothetical protein